MESHSLFLEGVRGTWAPLCSSRDWVAERVPRTSSETYLRLLWGQELEWCQSYGLGQEGSIRSHPKPTTYGELWSWGTILEVLLCLGWEGIAEKRVSSTRKARKQRVGLGEGRKGEDPRMFALWASSFILPMAQRCSHLS